MIPMVIAELIGQDCWFQEMIFDRIDECSPEIETGK